MKRKLQRLWRILKARILMPWNNLGCLGFKIDEQFYVDLFMSPPWIEGYGYLWSEEAPGGLRRALRAFIHDGIFRRWYTLTWQGWRLDKVEVLDLENAARIFRRTMKPYAIVQTKRGKKVECMSYPFLTHQHAEGNEWYDLPSIMVRTMPGDSSTLVEMDCDDLRPIQFSLRYTGIPANDPIVRRKPDDPDKDERFALRA